MTNIWIWIWRDNERTTIKSLLATIAETNRDSINTILKTLHDVMQDDKYQLTDAINNGNNVYKLEFTKKVNGVLQPDKFEEVRLSLYNLLASITNVVGDYSSMQAYLHRGPEYLSGHNIKFKLHYFGS